jgi:hypothetical protein
VNNVYVLNVAGPRESGKPGTQDLVESVMVPVLEFARGAYAVKIGGLRGKCPYTSES